MKAEQIGATAAYSFAHFGCNGGYEDYVWSFRRLGELGFRNFNLEILEDEHVGLFTPERVEAFRRLGEELGIELPIFTTYYLENDLVSISPERRGRALEKFRFSLDVAEKLGSSIMNFASEFPPELVGGYRDEYVHSPAGSFRLPPDQSWDEIWDTHVEMVRTCADLCAGRGMRLSLEPRANCLVSTVDSFLRLSEHVDRPNFGCSLDVLHTHYHREDIPIAIRKLGSALIDVQISDSDGQTLRHIGIGEGVIDFAAMVRALDEIGFGGILGLEIMVGDIDEVYRSSRVALERLLTESASASVSA